LERAFKRSSEGQRLDKLNAAEGLASETEALLRSKARKYIDAAYGKLSAPVFCTKRKHQAASSYTQNAPVAEVLITSIKSVFIGSTLTLIRTTRLSLLNPHREYGITTSTEDDISESAASMQRKRIRQEELSALSSNSSGRERSVSWSQWPSQNSRGDFSVKIDPFAYISAHQRDRRIGESNSNSRRKEFYDRRHEGGRSSRITDMIMPRIVIAVKTRMRGRRSGNGRDPKISGRLQEASGGCAGQE